MKADTYRRQNCQARLELRGFLTQQRWLLEQWEVVGEEAGSIWAAAAGVSSDAPAGMARGSRDNVLDVLDAGSSPPAVADT